MSLAPADSSAIAHARTRAARSRLHGRARVLLALIGWEVRKAHVGSALGLAWTVIQPLLFLGTYFFLFAVLRARNAGTDETSVRLLVILSGLVPWFFFARSVSQSLSSLARHAQFIKQINFPIGILPLISVAIPLVDYAVGVVLLVPLSLWAVGPGPEILLIVPSTLLMTVFLVGVASLVAPLAVMLPDLSVLLPPFLRIALFMTPVLYLPVLLPAEVSFLPYINPVSYFISPVRYAFFPSPDVWIIGPAGDAAVAVAITAVVALAAWLRRSQIRHTVDYV